MKNWGRLYFLLAVFVFATQTLMGTLPILCATPTESTQSEESPEGVKVSQERVSLDLKGVDLIELFRILSVKMGVTIVPSKSVAGRVNIFLNNLTFDETLEVIFVSQDLACERNANIINVMTAAEYEKLYGRKYNEKRKFKSLKLNYAKPQSVFTVLGQIKSDIGKIIVDESSGTILLMDTPEKLELMEKAVKNLDKPLETEVFELQYAKPADMKVQLSNVITSGAGELFVDERTTKVVVSDLPEKMKRIKQMVKAFDEENQQVLIEAEIVQIVLSDQYQHGVDWEKAFGSRFEYLKFIGKFQAGLSTYQQVNIGSMPKQHYQAVLQYLNTFGDSKVLSRPRIAAVSNQEAKILVGAREAYVSQTLSQAQNTTVTSESIEFVDVGIKLHVVPTINKEGFVTMKIKPEVSSVRETVKSALGSQIPIVETSEAETVVKVKDGTMIMIAGLMKEEKKDEQSRAPGVPKILTKIPLVKHIFGTRKELKKKTELIIFLTPHIMTGEAALENSEPQKLIPKEIMPEELRDAIILRELEKIKVKTMPSLEESIRSIQKEKTKVADIPAKMKGIKEY